MIAVGLTTIAGREQCVKDAINSLAPQVHKIFLARSKHLEFENVWPGKVTEIIAEGTDERKFSGVEFCGPNDIYFPCDDDLIYPPDYVRKTVSAMEDRPCVVTHHGRILRPPITSYYRNRGRAYSFRDDQLQRGIYLNIPGTGVSAFRIKDLRLSMSDFPAEFPRMSDIHFGILCQKKKIPIKLLTHSENWIRENRKSGMGIHQETVGKDALQVERCNQIEWHLYY